MAESFLYLTTTGRKSGKPHQIEIWYVEHDGCYFLCSEKREAADWVGNIRQNAGVTFYVAEREQDVPTQPGSAHIVNDEATTAILSQLFDDKYNWSDGLFVQICAD